MQLVVDILHVVVYSLHIRKIHVAKTKGGGQVETVEIKVDKNIA